MRNLQKNLKVLDGENKARTEITFIKSGDKKIFDPTEKANFFAKNLEEIFNPAENPNFDNNHKFNIENFINSNCLFNYELTEHNKPLNLAELDHQIDSLKELAALGPDGITNKHIKEAPMGVKLFLLNLINHSYLTGQVPEAFKFAKLTMIDKGKPDLNDPNNYRPISLTNSISKLMEKLIKARLSDYLEHNNLISESQSGFRKI